MLLIILVKRIRLKLVRIINSIERIIAPDAFATNFAHAALPAQFALDS